MVHGAESVIRARPGRRKFVRKWINWIAFAVVQASVNDDRILYNVELVCQSFGNRIKGRVSVLVRFVEYFLKWQIKIGKCGTEEGPRCSGKPTSLVYPQHLGWRAVRIEFGHQRERAETHSGAPGNVGPLTADF